MTELVEQARAAVLEFFRASPDEYVAIFTPNATGALRLVGEAYPFRQGDRFLLTFDNHNSVNGIREFARARGAETTYVPSVAPELRVDEALLPRYLTEVGGDHHNLFAYPAQSNFSGVQHPLEWIDAGARARLGRAARRGRVRADEPARPLRWHPTSSRSRSTRCSAGRPASACLLARREALAKLERPWFSGGTIVAAFVQREWYQSAARRGPLRGRHGRLPQPARGRDRARLLDRIGIERDPRARGGARPGAARRARRAAPLGRLARGDDLRPDAARSGAAPRSRSTSSTRTAASSTSATSTGSPGGTSISLRTGCFCNPGAGEIAFTISRETLVGGEFGDGMTLDDYVQAIGLPSGGAVRASLGLASNLADVERFAAFAAEFVDLADVPDDLPPRTGC